MLVLLLAVVSTFVSVADASAQASCPQLRIAKSTLSASPTTLPASTASTIVVQLRNNGGNPVGCGGVWVTFSTNFGTLSQTSNVLTDANGLATVTLTSAVAGTATVAAFINSSNASGAPGVGSPASVVFTAIDYTITFDSAGGSAVADITQAVGTAVTAPADPTRAGNTFAGWSPAVPGTMPVGGAALTAQWTAIDYTITFDSAGGSAV
ncbi:MAG: InlB B-repeat-containing protein, partial [Pikeienuella sp.]